MKRALRYLLGSLLLLFVISSCGKEKSFETAAPGKGSLQNDAGECAPKIVGGSFIAGKPTTDSNYIEVGIYVAKKGGYQIVSDTVNKYYFKGTGNFTDTGFVTIRLKASGTPAVAGKDLFTLFFDSSFCEVTIPVTDSTTMPVTCPAVTVQGTYTAGTPLTASNKATLSYTYASSGNFMITTNTVNGYSFSGSVMATAGTPVSISLAGSGTPVAAGSNTFTINFGDGNNTCTFPVTVN